MAEEGIFRFLSVRPADLKKKQSAKNKKVPLYSQPGATELQASLEEARKRGAPKGEILAIARAFKESPHYAQDLEALGFGIRPLLVWMAEKGDQLLRDLELRKEVQTLYKLTVDEILRSIEFQRTFLNLADSFLVDNLLRGIDARRADDMAAALKLMRLLQSLGGTAPQPREGRLGDLISQTVLVLPDTADLSSAPADVPANAPAALALKVEEPGEPKRQAEAGRNRLADLEAAHRELSRLVSDERALSRPEPAKAAVKREAAPEGTAAADIMPEDAVPRGGAVLTSQAAKGLSEASRNALLDLRIDPEQVDPLRTVSLIEREMQHLGSQLSSEQVPGQLLVFGGVHVDLQKLRASLATSATGASELPPVPRSSRFQAGTGDLLLVRQKLKAHELGEFAHIENVLQGETREREHRRLDLREEIDVIEVERETEKQRDLQSTERNELQSEAEKTVRSQIGIEAGVQTSGSYGPCFNFSASLNASFSTTTEETQRKAMSYSREVTEKTSERIREKVRTERRVRVLQEIEEINRHKFENTGDSKGNVRGVYRWLNKIYEAQVFNYGQRMMYEFVIPEPAAYYLHALVENPPQERVLEKPVPPLFHEAPLRPANLTRSNYHDYVAQYRVRAAPAPPSQFQSAAAFAAQDGNAEGNFGRSSKIDVAAGYEAYGADVMFDFVREGDGDPSELRVRVGGQALSSSGSVTFAPRRKELTFSASLLHGKSFGLGIDVHAQLTSESFAAWQHNMFDAIQQAYLEQKIDYEEKLQAAALQKEVQILGRNPLENRRIERDELKKMVLMMLTGSPSIGLTSFQPGAPGSEPVLDLNEAYTNGARIRFFENAFEWINLLYVFYPYFWGRPARWQGALSLTDPDPDFAAFLKAGAARVQVPVRPGFEKAVVHFCQFDEIWEGNDIPLRDDDLYVAIVDEITENLGKLDAGVPYPEDSKPWEVTVPTSLVVVQDLDEIPAIRDILTGKPIDLENKNG